MTRMPSTPPTDTVQPCEPPTPASLAPTNGGATSRRPPRKHYRDVLSGLTWQRIDFVHLVPQDVAGWPGFAGLLLRSALGRALLETDASAAQALYSGATSLPWSLRPPALMEPGWLPGGTALGWSVSLFGPAAALAPAVVAAAGRLRLHTSAASDPPAAPHLVDCRQYASSALDVFAAEHNPASTMGARQPFVLRLQTPLDLKPPPGLASYGPDLVPTLPRLLRAVTAAIHAITGDTVDVPMAESPALRETRSTAPLAAGVHPFSISKARSGQYMRCEGIVGELVFAGPEADAMAPWFALARQLHLGRRRHYGFGIVSWDRAAD